MTGKTGIKFFVYLIFSSLLLLAADSHAFLESNKTGGMSELFLGDTKVKVDGGFIDSYDGEEIHVRAKGLEVTLNIDNSASNEDKTFRFFVHNVNPEKTKIIGFETGAVDKGTNSLSFSAPLKAKKITIYKLTPDIAEEEGFLFMVFGESRGGEHVFRRIIGDINYRKPLFALSCGDMVEDGSSGSYKDFMKEIGKVKVPFLTVVGESEVPMGSRRRYEDNLGATYYSFDFRNVHFILLDNGDNRMSEEQFLWLENDLMNNKAIHTFVFMHRPPFDPRPGRDQPMNLGTQYRRLSGILEKYKVSRVFSSGIHGYFKEERGSVPYVITGGGGSELASSDAFYNYVLVEVTQDKVKDKLIKLVSPPLGWYESIEMKASLYVKNSLQTHPVRFSIYVVIALFVIASILRLIYRSLFKRQKRRIVL